MRISPPTLPLICTFLSLFLLNAEIANAANSRTYSCTVSIFALYSGKTEEKIVEQSFKGKVESLNSPILHDEYLSLYSESHRVRFVINPLGLTTFPGDPLPQENAWYYLYNQTAHQILAEGHFSVRGGARLPSNFALQDFFLIPGSTKQHLVRLACSLG